MVQRATLYSVPSAPWDWIYTPMVHTSKLRTASLNPNFMAAKNEESGGERSTKDIQFQLWAASQGLQNLTQTLWADYFGLPSIQIPSYMKTPLIKDQLSLRLNR